MDMKKYLAALQAKEATQQAPLCNDANTILELLYPIELHSQIGGARRTRI